MIDVKQAIRAAFAFIQDIYSEHEPLRDPRLEEVELLENETQWLVTLSFLREEPRDELPVALTKHLSPKYRRVYKGLLVDADTGQVRTMKMRAEV